MSVVDLFVNEHVSTSTKLNKDFDKVGLWANQWKLSFNSDPSKQAEEVIFYIRKSNSKTCPNDLVTLQFKKISIQKHQAIYIDKELRGGKPAGSKGPKRFLIFTLIGH